MVNPANAPDVSPHRGPSEPSPWVRRYLGAVARGGLVLDLACGRGRHARLALERGYRVVALDRDVSDLADIAGHPRLEIVPADLENGAPFPLAGRCFDGIVVTNYLYRPLFPALFDALGEDGVLIYETFARGNEKYGKPRNPDHLLRPGELLDVVRGHLRVTAYEDREIRRPRRAVVQRIAARREDGFRTPPPA